MQLLPLNSVFRVTYGNKFDLNKMTLPSDNSQTRVRFIGRTARNNGVVAMVASLEDQAPYPAGCITVALGGAILSSFLQTRPFYTAQNVAVLKPLKKLTANELLFYCLAIQHNRFRYGAFGREANRTLRTLLVPAPESIPSWVKQQKAPDFRHLVEPVASTPVAIEAKTWKLFRLDQLFEIRKGKRLTKQNMRPGNTPFIGSSDSNNGLTARIGQAPIHSGNTISVCYNGSVAEAFYQPRPYWATDDVNVLYPKFRLNPYIALFITTIIKKEKYRYNYGRKWHLGRMNESEVQLPVDDNGSPDWAWMEAFIKTLPYSSAIEESVA